MARTQHRGSSLVARPWRSAPTDCRSVRPLLSGNSSARCRVVCAGLVGDRPGASAGRCGAGREAQTGAGGRLVQPGGWAHKSEIRADVHLARVDDLRLGLAFRAARIRRRLRQQDLAQIAGVSDSLVSRLEHGELARLSVGALRAIAAKLGIRLTLDARWQGGDLDRLVSARHAALGERVAAYRSLFQAWLPHDGRTLGPLFRQPANGPASGICFWPDSTGAGIGRSFSAQQRVAGRRDRAESASPRSTTRTGQGSRDPAVTGGPADRA